MKDVVHTIILIITNPFRNYVKTEEIMALLELPGKAPSLKLILSLLEHTSAVMWLLVHFAAMELSTCLLSNPN